MKNGQISSQPVLALDVWYIPNIKYPSSYFAAQKAKKNTETGLHKNMLLRYLGKYMQERKKRGH